MLNLVHSYTQVKSYGPKTNLVTATLPFVLCLLLLCFYVLLYLAKKFDRENAAEDARKYQSEGGAVRNTRNNQEHLAVVGRSM